MGLIFDERSMMDDNIFKYEQRFKAQTSKFIENGAMLVTYWTIADNQTTVNRGMRDIEELFGDKAPLRFNRIRNFPVYGFGASNPENTDEANVEDINISGECIIIPGTIVPNPNDFFTINHYKGGEVKAVYQVVNVDYDCMHRENYYKIRYRLHSTTQRVLDWLEKQTVGNYNTDLNAIGTNLNPIIEEDTFILKTQVQQMVNQMIQSYRGMFYDSRHNCFLFYNQERGERWFDMCANEFIAKHSLMNPPNSSKVIVLHSKLEEKQFGFYYNNSIYNWLELGAPKRLLRKFHFQLSPAEYYTHSSFARWNEGDIEVIQPLGTHQVGINNQDLSFFDEGQYQGFEQTDLEPTTEYEKLIWKYLNRPNELSIKDVSLFTGDALLNSIRHVDVFLYTPIILYLIRKIQALN